MKVLSIAILLLALSGCAGESDPKKPGITGFVTGRDSVNAYQKTKSKIADINKTLRNRYNAVK